MRLRTIFCRAKRLPLIVAAAMLSLAASASKIKGRVINASKEPVDGATVSVKGSNIAVITDNKGFFTLDWPKDTAVLTVSCVGFETRDYPAGSNTGMVIITLLASSNSLADVEVVSTGYQDIPKERASGSFVKVSNATLNQQAGTNILKRLDGVTSGLLFNTGKTNNNPQNTTNISIRGLSTISGPLDPLIVLDGFIYEGDINNINPNDVENVTVLKDAAAASIWGARAGNGVIVITTKKARLGQKASVTASAGIIVSKKPDLYSLPVMSSADYVGMEEYLFNKGYFDALANDPVQALTPAVDIFLQRRQGLISARDSAVMSDLLRATDSRDQYLRYFYREAVTQQYAASIRGGGDRNTYLFSAAYDHAAGEIYTLSKKLNLRVENSFRPSKQLQLDVSAYYTNSQSGGGRNVTYGSVMPGGRPVTYARFADEAGKALPVALSLRKSYTDTAGTGLLLDWGYYPLDDYRHRVRSSGRDELYGRLALSYRPAGWLDIDLGYQYQRQGTEDRFLAGAGSFTARSLINNFSQVDRVAGTVTRPVPLGGILEESGAVAGSQTLRLQAGTHLTKGDHSVAAILGAEARETSGTYSRHTLYGYQEDPLSYRAVDFVDYYPRYINGGTDIISGAPLESGRNTGRFLSLYGNASYTFRKKYTLTGSMRRDGSNIFGASTNDRWKPLWSAGAVWKISAENFYHAGILPSLSLRASYGYSGNVDLSRTAEAVGTYSPSAAVSRLPFTRVQNLNNPSLRWEQTGILNIGTDFALRGGRLSGTLEYYLKNGRDLYGTAPYDYTGWGRSALLLRNAAAMRGQGLDLTVDSRNITGAFSWNTTLLLSYNSSKTTRYDAPGAQNSASLLGGGNGITPVVGKPLYAIAAYRWAGLDSTGSPRGYLAGTVSTDYAAIMNEAAEKGTVGGIVYAGPSSPTWFGSLSNTFSFRNLSLTANIAYRGGYWFRKSTISYTGLVTAGAGHSDFSRRWVAPGDEKATNVPSFIYPVDEYRDAFYQQSEVNVLNGSHLRLQYINLAYRMACYRLLKGGSAEFYVNLANIGIIWRANKENIDPDYPAALRPPLTSAAGLRIGF